MTHGVSNPTILSEIDLQALFIFDEPELAIEMGEQLRQHFRVPESNDIPPFYYLGVYSFEAVSIFIPQL